MLEGYVLMIIAIVLFLFNIITQRTQLTKQVQSVLRIFTFSAIM